MMFQSMGGDTATAAIASVVVCLLTTAVLGFSKLAWIEKLVTKTAYKVEDTWDGIKPQEEKKHRRRSGSVVDEAIARSILDQ